MEREKDQNLRTKVLLGHRDLKLSIKRKGDDFYKRVSVEYFGELPGFNFTKIAEKSPGLPSGRRCFSGVEDDPSRTRKRTVCGVSASPALPEASRPRTEDWSHDGQRNDFYIPHGCLALFLLKSGV